MCAKPGRKCALARAEHGPDRDVPEFGRRQPKKVRICVSLQKFFFCRPFFLWSSTHHQQAGKVVGAKKKVVSVCACFLVHVCVPVPVREGSETTLAGAVSRGVVPVWTSATALGNLSPTLAALIDFGNFLPTLLRKTNNTRNKYCSANRRLKIRRKSSEKLAHRERLRANTHTTRRTRRK